MHPAPRSAGTKAPRSALLHLQPGCPPSSPSGGPRCTQPRPHRRGLFQTGQSMKEAIKTAFKQALEKHEALAATAKQEQADKLTATHGFEIEYRRVRDNVIIPALKEVANDLLEPAGWKCDVRQD